MKTLCTNIRWIDPKSKGSENLAMACDFLPRSFRSHDIKRPDDDFDDAEDDDTASSDGQLLYPKLRFWVFRCAVEEKKGLVTQNKAF